MIELDKKYSYRNLFYMRKFFLTFKYEIVNAVRSNLSWTHYRILLKLDDIEEINYYINLCSKQNLSTRELERRIKLNEYGRLDEETKEKLVKKEETQYEIVDFIKHPIVLKNKYDALEISEKMLKQLILEDIGEFFLAARRRIFIYR